MRVRSFHIADLAALDSAPFDRELELAVIDGERAHALAFPCRGVIGGWIDAETNKRGFQFFDRPRGGGRDFVQAPRPFLQKRRGDRLSGSGGYMGRRQRWPMPPAKREYGPGPCCHAQGLPSGASARASTKSNRMNAAAASTNAPTRGSGSAPACGTSCSPKTSATMNVASKMKPTQSARRLELLRAGRFRDGGGHRLSVNV
jgi:hypothetical protein